MHFKLNCECDIEESEFVDFVEIMEASWQYELLKYWRVIENETEMLLTRDCIKDHVLFDPDFKDDFIHKVHKR